MKHLILLTRRNELFSSVGILCVVNVGRLRSRVVDGWLIVIDTSENICSVGQLSVFAEEDVSAWSNHVGGESKLLAPHD